jgi:Protein of unknown function (DUF1176)
MLSLLLVTAASAASAPKPGELKTFADWIVGCDNGRACQAVALMPDNEFEGTTMVIRRGAEPLARPSVSISIQKGQAASLAVDGKRLAVRLQNTGREIQIDNRDCETLIAAMRAGKRFAVIDASGEEIGAPSISGLSAALLYMDDRQHRVGTVTALARKGTKPASVMPPSPPLPVIVSPKVPRMPPRSITVAQATALIGEDNAECEYSVAKVDPKAQRLDATHSLVMVDHPCGNGAYNLFSSTFVVDQAGRVTPARFDAEGGMGGDGDSGHVLVNADWDEKTHRLSTYAKGRGLGDCGSIQSFAWDGIRFRLAEQSVMGECRGSVDYITTWRTLVR